MSMDQQQLLTDLKALRELFSDRSRWTQGVEARNGSGLPVAPMDPDAVCFCLLGGVIKVTDDEVRRYEALRFHISGMIFPQYRSLIAFNDGSGYDQVQAMLDRAQAKIEDWVRS